MGVDVVERDLGKRGGLRVWRLIYEKYEIGGGPVEQTLFG